MEHELKQRQPENMMLELENRVNEKEDSLEQLPIS